MTEVATVVAVMAAETVEAAMEAEMAAAKEVAALDLHMLRRPCTHRPQG